MKTMESKPAISLSEGLTIGYPGRTLSRSKETRLATAKKDIRLGAGRHLLLARNGRGKTTLLKTIAQIIPAIDGHAECIGGVQFVDEDLRFDSELKPRQLFRALLNREQCQFAEEMAERIELDLEKPCGQLSKGNRQKASLIVAEASAYKNGPQILLLDEPFSGLDFAARERLNAVWRENQDRIIRLICIHPDEPTLEADSALIICDGELKQVAVDGALDWRKTRPSLN